MKKLFVLIAVLISLNSFSQRITKRLGLNPTTGKAGYIFTDTAKTPRAVYPLKFDGDSTFSFTDSAYYISTFSSNASNDSVILTLLNGRRLAAKAAAAGGGGASGWPLTGATGTTFSNYLGTTDPQSTRIGTNGVVRMIVDSLDGGTSWDFPYSTTGVHFNISNGTRLGGAQQSIYLSGGAGRYADFSSGLDFNIGNPTNKLVTITSISIALNKAVTMPLGWSAGHISSFISGGYQGIKYNGSGNNVYYGVQNQNNNFVLLHTPTGNTVVGPNVVYTDEATSSSFTVKSTLGTLPWGRGTTTQRTGLTLDATNDGMAYYDITLHKLYINENGTWVQK